VNIPAALKWAVWECNNFTCQVCGSRGVRQLSKDLGQDAVQSAEAKLQLSESAEQLMGHLASGIGVGVTSGADAGSGGAASSVGGAAPSGGGVPIHPLNDIAPTAANVNNVIRILCISGTSFHFSLRRFTS